MYISQPCKTLLLTTSCALVLLSGGALCHAQAADPQNADSIDYLYVSPQGNDAWSGQSPTASSVGGPFQTLAHAQEAVTALADPGLTRPVEVIFDNGVCSSQDFLKQWFTSAPANPVIWHSELNHTVLIYTRTMAEQNEALSAEDYSNASVSPITRYYVSPTGSDDSSGLYPTPDSDNGPFLSLTRAQEAVIALHTENPNAPVEVVIEGGFAGSPDFLDTATGNGAHKPVKHPAAAIVSKKAVSLAKPKAKRLTPKATVGAVAVRARAAVTAASKLVFAHYMVCNADYGGSVAAYEHDIQDAQSAGVDGFVLNCGAWNAANYKKSTAAMFNAAHTLNTGFKLFFSIDVGGGSISPAEIQDMVTTYGNDTNYFHYLGRPVLSTWGGDGSNPSATKSFWQDSVLTPLRAAGYNIYFVPQFNAGSPQNSSSWLSSAVQAQASYQLWWTNYINSLSVVDGLFEAAMSPPMKYSYSRTVAAAPVAAGQQGGLTLRDQHWECFYDPTHEFTGDDLGRTITIAGNADFNGGTYTIVDVEGGYPMTDQAGNSLGNHTMIVLALPGGIPSPAKHYDATGGGYTVQSPYTTQKGESLLAEERYAQVAHANGKLFISSVSPQYWTSLITADGRYYAEFCGGEGLAAQWNSIISVQKPEWVEMFTWNDFGENSYFSPIDDVAKYWPYALPGTKNNVVGYMKSHAGFTALNKYFISWYKTGIQPAVKGDNIYYFYRTQPMNMVASDDPLGPVSNQSGPISDTIYITSQVASPATLQVKSGSSTQTFTLKAGTTTLRVPFSTGAQTFTLLRNGHTVLTQLGAPIVSNAPTYNFSLYSSVMSTQTTK